MMTYNLGSTDTTVVLISRVRFELGDTVYGSGVLPDGSNLTDAEIQTVLEANGNDVAKTVAALAATLARRWANQADVAVGPRKESLSQVSERWQTLARESQALPPAGFSVGLSRVDGYSEAAASSDEYSA